MYSSVEKRGDIKNNKLKIIFDDWFVNNIPIFNNKIKWLKNKSLTFLGDTD